MRTLFRSLIVFIIIVLAVHASAYFLIRTLPESSVIALGINSVQSSALEGFNSSLAIKSYPEMLLGVLKLDLGLTIDKVPVIAELKNSIKESFPRILLATFLVFCVGFITGLFFNGKNKIQGLSKLIDFGIFMPSFFLPLLIYSIFISVGVFGFKSDIRGLLWVGCVFSMAFPPVLMVYSQSTQVMKKLLNLSFVQRYRSIGFSEKKLHWKLLRNLTDEIAPTFEKLITAMLTQIILAETIFGLSGIGSLTVRAVRRSDLNLLLGIVLFFAVSIGILRITTVFIRIRSRGWR